MGSFRSLITFLILIGVGYFLFTRINEPPAGAQLQPGVAPEGVPPLTGMSAPGAPAANFDANAGSTDAPQWTPPAAAAPSTPASMPAISAEAPPAIPKMPDMPDLSAGSTTASPPPPTALPDNIPTAQYTGATLPPEGISGQVPSLGTTTPNYVGTPEPPGVTSPDTALPVAPADSASLSPAPPMTPGLTAAPEVAAAPSNETSSLSATPSAPSLPASAAMEDNRYGEIAPASATMANPPQTVGVSKFAEGWPAIQSALERGELARAHLLLSQWYGDPSLAPEESQQVESLLGQLAGTVVYSTEHQLEPPYLVRPGDTLETIAQQYNVPWQLLAKINGIPAANQVQPGQQLKVVRGPFSAVIETGRNQLTLMLDGRYAGRFSVDTSSAPLPEGEWVVADKPASPLGQTSPYGATMSAGNAVARSLLLRDVAATAANPGVPITIGSQPSHEARVAGLATQQSSPHFVRVSPTDADELADILSVGSRVEIRR